jgi:uncharacterized repeat protein (TIGR03803 family)
MERFMERFDAIKAASILTAFFLATTVIAPAQTFTDLLNFDGQNGVNPMYGSLIQTSDGNLYGTTLFGSNDTRYCSTESGWGCGTIFEISTAGTLTTLYTFCSLLDCSDGGGPWTGVVQGTDGDLYGTTTVGGSNGGGTVFKITLEGGFRTLHDFCSEADCGDGSNPYAGLVQATNGNFYGTTTINGAHNVGTVFEITPAGKFTVLYSFCSQAGCSDGETPQGALIQAKNGNLYGTTLRGGVYGAGTIFEITLAGKLITLYSFDYKDGANPYTGLMQASNGDIYGTTEAGGTRNNGTVFEITAAGKLKTIYNFCVKTYCSDGAIPASILVQGTNGNLFATTYLGGNNSRGTVFEITTAGKLTTLYSFCSQTDCTDGANPYAGVIQATNGVLYGTTYQGGDVSCTSPYGCGSIFSLSVESK